METSATSPGTATVAEVTSTVALDPSDHMTIDVDPEIDAAAPFASAAVNK